ncbi:hypothetical protein SAMN04489725_11857 [Alicyclobacillus hesperidum]|uniref:Uncharacterized protein n=1 Tax=Alicyclobacillus hesperidum TaxID=89784 RepID=A0A1H2X7J0_9BACL|nr:hypothetical protein SAMN04489725_11857 [Alicyclobacillus hesperidum]
MPETGCSLIILSTKKRTPGFTEMRRIQQWPDELRNTSLKRWGQMAVLEAEATKPPMFTHTKKTLIQNRERASWPSVVGLVEFGYNSGRIFENPDKQGASKWRIMTRVIMTTMETSS